MRYTLDVILHQHDFYEFYYALSDGGTQEIPEKSIGMRKGDLFVFPPKQPHIGNGDIKHCVDCIVLYVDRNIFDRNRASEYEVAKILELLAKDSATRDFRVPLHSKERNSVGNILEEVVTEQTRALPGMNLAVRIAIQRFLLTILRAGGVSSEQLKLFSNVKSRQSVANVCRFIDANYSSQISVTQLTSVASISRSHLHAVFSKETGKTLTQYINEHRCHHALTMLHDTDLSSSEIAVKSGFASVSNFYRAFREFSNLSPRDIRETSSHILNKACPI